MPQCVLIKLLKDQREKNFKQKKKKKKNFSPKKTS